jgi:predicted dehydrogenase
VRVPSHRSITMAALKAGKAVYCEWPLGADVGQAQEMTAFARERGVSTMVGLQARSDPSLMYLRKLVADGYLGEIVTAHMTIITPGSLSRPSARAWMGDRANGANTLTIAGGHNIDAIAFCLGDFVAVSGKVVTRINQVKASDTDEMLALSSPDNVLVTGTLGDGAVVSIHVASVPYQGSGGWRLDVYGTEGTIFASGAQANYSPEPIRLLGAKGSEKMAELPIPDEFVLVPEGTPQGAPYNLAQAYTRLSDAWRSGQPVEPDFETGVRLHRLLAAMEQASDEGRTVTVE